MKKLLIAFAMLIASAGTLNSPAGATTITQEQWWIERNSYKQAVSNDENSYRIEPAAYTSNNIIAYADNYIGYTERKNRRELTKKLKIDPVETPWCAGFVNYILESVGFKSTGSLEAASYNSYGYKVQTPISGDIVLVRRNGGSGRHVGFFHSFASENGIKYVVVLGGNQDGSVSLKKYPVSSVTGYRRPVN